MSQRQLEDSELSFVRILSRVFIFIILAFPFAFCFWIYYRRYKYLYVYVNLPETLEPWYRTYVYTVPSSKVKFAMFSCFSATTRERLEYVNRVYLKY